MNINNTQYIIQIKIDQVPEDLTWKDIRQFNIRGNALRVLRLKRLNFPINSYRLIERTLTIKETIIK